MMIGSLEPPAALADEARLGQLLAGAPASVEELAALMDVYPSAVAKARRAAGVSPVLINGSRAKGLKAGWLYTRL